MSARTGRQERLGVGAALQNVTGAFCITARPPRCIGPDGFPDGRMRSEPNCPAWRFRVQASTSGGSSGSCRAISVP